MKDKALEYANLISEIEALEEKANTIKKELIANGQTILLPEIGKKVAFIPEQEMKEIDACSLGGKLIIEKRIPELLNIISISKKSLTDKLTDASSLIAEFEVSKGTIKSATVSVKPLSKDDKANLA